MTGQDYILLLAVLVGVAVIYYVDDGRIRVATVALLGGLLWWRRNKRVTQKLPPIQPIPPDTKQVDTDAQTTDARIDAITRDRSDDPDVRAGLDLLRERDAKRRAARRGR